MANEDITMKMYLQNLARQQAARQDWLNYSKTARLLEGFGISTSTRIGGGGYGLSSQQLIAQQKERVRAVPFGEIAPAPSIKTPEQLEAALKEMNKPKLQDNVGFSSFLLSRANTEQKKYDRMAKQLKSEFDSKVSSLEKTDSSLTKQQSNLKSQLEDFYQREYADPSDAQAVADRLQSQIDSFNKQVENRNKELSNLQAFQTNANTTLQQSFESVKKAQKTSEDFGYGKIKTSPYSKLQVIEPGASIEFERKQQALVSEINRTPTPILEEYQAMQQLKLNPLEAGGKSFEETASKIEQFGLSKQAGKWGGLATGIFSGTAQTFALGAKYITDINPAPQTVKVPTPFGDFTLAESAGPAKRALIVGDLAATIFPYEKIGSVAGKVLSPARTIKTQSLSRELVNLGFPIKKTPIVQLEKKGDILFTYGQHIDEPTKEFVKQLQEAGFSPVKVPSKFQILEGSGTKAQQKAYESFLGSISKGKKVIDIHSDIGAGGDFFVKKYSVPNIFGLEVPPIRISKDKFDLAIKSFETIGKKTATKRTATALENLEKYLQGKEAKKTILDAPVKRGQAFQYEQIRTGFEKQYEKIIKNKELFFKAGGTPEQLFKPNKVSFDTIGLGKYPKTKSFVYPKTKDFLYPKTIETRPFSAGFEKMLGETKKVLETSSKLNKSIERALFEEEIKKEISFANKKLFGIRGARVQLGEKKPVFSKKSFLDSGGEIFPKQIQVPKPTEFEKLSKAVKKQYVPPKKIVATTKIEFPSIYAGASWKTKAPKLIFEEFSSKEKSLVGSGIAAGFLKEFGKEKTKEFSVSVPKMKATEGIKEEPRLSSGVSSRSILAALVLPSTKIKSKTVQFQAMRTNEKEKELENVITGTISKPKPRLFEAPKIPKTPIKENMKFKLPRTPDEKTFFGFGESQYPGFDVFVRSARPKKIVRTRKGIKVRPIIEGAFEKKNKKPLVRSQALSLGSKLVDNSIRATFKISPTKKKAAFDPGLSTSFNREKFRSSKKNPELFVEKNEFRIDSPTEKRQLLIGKIETKKIKKRFEAF